MNWQKVQRHFAAASELPPEARAAYLDTEIVGEDEIKIEVERLLGLVNAASDFLERPALATEFPGEVGERASARLTGQEIGPYRLECQIGEGGMGTVYLASRIDEAYRKKVAIKLVVEARSKWQTLQRFQDERHILAELEHPNIARLYDGGTTEGGLPYLVMEYVAGQRIDTFCKDRDLDLKSRLRLFRQVCAAVSYAHRSLLVHRDLKPSNILVTDEGVPKLLDFGIAKSLAPGVGTAETRTGQRLMTPSFASPEQIRGSRTITTASDVYSLGVLLFRLLTEDSPYRPDDEASDFSLQQAVLEQEPIKPSTAVRDSALARQLRGDLDSIVLKALRKEPEQRYNSVEALSTDLSRYGEGMPVRAREGSWRYRAGKFIARHRTALAASVIATLALTGLALALIKQSRIAIQEGSKAQETLSVMEEAFMAFDPEQARGQDVSAREVLNASASIIQTRDDAEIRASLLTTIGVVLTRLGEFDDAEPLLTEAYDLRIELGKNVGIGLYQLGELEWSRRRYREAEAFYRKALATLNKDTADHGRATRGLGLSLGRLGKNNEAKRYLNGALTQLREHFADSDPEIMAITFGLGLAERDSGSYPRAEALFIQLVGKHRRNGPGPALGRSLAELGIVKYRQGELGEAKRLLEEALPMLRKSMGGDNTYVAEVLGKQIAVFSRLGDDVAAENAIHEILQVLPPDHPGTGTTFHNLAIIQTNRGDLEDAESSAQKALELQRSNFGDAHENVAISLCLLGRIAISSGDPTTAEVRYSDCLQVAESTGNARLLAVAHEGLSESRTATEIERKNR